MPVGPGGIRVFRVDDKAEKKPKKTSRKKAKSHKSNKETSIVHTVGAKSTQKCTNKNARKASSENTTKPRNSANEAQNKFIHSLDKKLEPLDTIRVKHQLVLNEKQKARLKALFSAPNALASMLRAYPQRLTTPSDASTFLLRNRKQLDTYINPDARERAVDLLTELLLQWSGNPPESIGIDFDNVSLTPEQKVYLPLAGYRGIEVAEPMQLLRQRRGRLFKAPFTLFEEGKNFFVAFSLEPKQVSEQAARVVKQSPRNNRSRKIQMKPGQPLPYISGMRNKPHEPRQRVLFSKYSGVFRGGIKTMNWGGLFGWGVNGGLPSLGKRSR
ncbi:MAG: hypothetical protein Q4F13_02205 [Pseudomonadota bacterium]|nr:hypothetical protein [Pseudomonadota bacterium]